MAREFTKVGVIGLGTMGAGIVEVFARNGIDVVAVEVTDEAVEKGRGVLAALHRPCRHPRQADAPRTRRRCTPASQFTSDMADLKECQLVVEAVPEHLDLKKDIFAKLDAIVSDDAILATNTSSLPVTEIAVATINPKRVVGMHFFNPAPVLQFVEVIKTVITSDEIFEDVKALAERLGKKPVIVGDKAGFIANALLFGYLNHAVAMYESKYATREDIDAAMKLGCGYPMGPLALMDLIGLDTAYEILDTMYKQGRDRLHAPSPIIKQMVSAGLKGRKSGRGFYTYAEPGSSAVVDDALTPTAADGSAAGTRPVRTVGVVGSGTMATGMVEVFAKAGLDVTFVARSEAKVEAVRDRPRQEPREGGPARQGHRGGARRGARAASAARRASRTSPQVDLVVEAVVEDLTVKRALFENLDEICRPGAILATTTSSLPVVECAAATKRPQDVIGMHFFNPAQVMKLVEVVHTVSTADDVVATVQALCDDGRQARRDVRRPRRLHRQRAALPLPQRRREDARGQLLDGRRHRHRDEDRLRPADGSVRAARRRRPRRVARHRARALPRVPRARLRARAAARAPRHGRLPRPQDGARLPHLRLTPTLGPCPRVVVPASTRASTCRST